MQRLLIISKKSLGDIILQTGVIHALKEAHPRMQITVACDARNASVGKNELAVAEVLPLTLKGEQAAGFLSLLKAIRSKRYDAVLTFGRDSQACLWGFLARIKVRVGVRNQPLKFLLTRTAIEHATEINSFEYYHKLGALVSPQLKMQ